MYVTYELRIWQDDDKKTTMHHNVMNFFPQFQHASNLGVMDIGYL